MDGPLQLSEITCSHLGMLFSLICWKSQKTLPFEEDPEQEKVMQKSVGCCVNFFVPWAILTVTSDGA